MMNFLISIIGIIVTILIVVGIHELGHFLMARLFGIKVLRFSIGFGKALYRWYDKKGTEYVIAAIPLGGYVKILDENEEPVPAKEAHLAFNRQALYKRTAIILAGSLSNLLFAFLIYWLLFVVGFTSVVPTIGNVKPHSIAAEAGLKPQQEIISVDNKPAATWTSIIIGIFSRAGDKTTMQIETKSANKKIKTHDLNLATWHMDDLKPEPLESLGFTPYEPPIATIIGRVAHHSPAEEADLEPGDKIIAVDNAPIKDWRAFINKVTENPDKTLSFTVKRQGKIFIAPVTIGHKRTLFFKKYGYLGVVPNFEWPKHLLRKNQYGPVTALSHAWRDTVDFTHLNFIVLGKILTGKVSLRSLGGPVTIFQSAGTALNEGIAPFLSFLAFLSIAIGILNILPIPGLDGGHLLFQFCELILRRPLSQAMQVLLYRFGLIFLLLVLVQALVNDIMRLQ